MNKVAIVLFLTFNITNAQITKDKKLHYTAGVVSSYIGYETVYKLTKNKKKAVIGGILTSVIAGVLKETIDSTQRGNKFDKHDLLATTLGGISFGFTIRLFDKNKKRRK